MESRNGEGLKMYKIKGKYTTALVTNDRTESQCVSQITKMTNHPAFVNSIVIQPDAHAGKGSCIGFTMKLGEEIGPSIVGVDIGCGVTTHYIGKRKVNFKKLDTQVRNSIPFGFKVRSPDKHHVFRLTSGNSVFTNAIGGAIKLRKSLESAGWDSLCKVPSYNEGWFLEMCKRVGEDPERVHQSIGTLGGGNHFISIDYSTLDGSSSSNSLYISIHSGSRRLGKSICEYWQNLARDQWEQGHKDNYRKMMEEATKNTPPADRERVLKELKGKYKIGIDIKGMETLSGDEAVGYLYDMIFAQEYASYNRLVMLRDILGILDVPYRPEDTIESVHNYIDMDDLIVRKGAIRSYEGEKMVIPWNMKDGLVIAEGKSNPEWNFSAPHGAGRKMSRTEAKKRLSKDEAKKQMSGIYTSVIPLDEAPGAYKDASEVEGLLGPTADVLDRIKPVHNMKAGK